MIPGICLCLAPGVGASGDVMYSLRQGGFLAGSGATTPDPIFFRADGSAFSAMVGATVRTQGPLGKIEFFMQPAFVGRYSGSMTSPMPVTGFMANAGYTGGSSNRHRNGRGRYMIVPREVARRIAQALHLDNPLPTQSGLSEEFSEFLEVADDFLGDGAAFGDWFNNLNAVLRGTMDLAVLSYLIFDAR